MSGSSLFSASAAFEPIQDALTAAAVAVLEGQGCSCRLRGGGRRGPDIASEQVAALIGFAAQYMRGSLVVIAARETVAGLQPGAMPRAWAAEAALLPDLLGELSNMILGRLKNQLLARGVTLMMGTPTAAMARGLEIREPAGKAWVWHQVTTDAGCVFVRFEATFEDGFVLADLDGPHETAIAEGEMVLF